MNYLLKSNSQWTVSPADPTEEGTVLIVPGDDPTELALLAGRLIDIRETREPGTGRRPCFGGRGGKNSPTSSNQSGMKVPVTTAVRH